MKRYIVFFCIFSIGISSSARSFSVSDALITLVPSVVAGWSLWNTEQSIKSLRQKKHAVLAKVLTEDRNTGGASTDELRDINDIIGARRRKQAGAVVAAAGVTAGLVHRKRKHRKRRRKKRPPLASQDSSESFSSIQSLPENPITTPAYVTSSNGKRYGINIYGNLEPVGPLRKWQSEPNLNDCKNKSKKEKSQHSLSRRRAHVLPPLSPEEKMQLQKGKQRKARKRTTRSTQQRDSRNCEDRPYNEQNNDQLIKTLQCDLIELQQRALQVIDDMPGIQRDPERDLECVLLKNSELNDATFYFFAGTKNLVALQDEDMNKILNNCDVIQGIIPLIKTCKSEEVNRVHKEGVYKLFNESWGLLCSLNEPSGLKKLREVLLELVEGIESHAQFARKYQDKQLMGESTPSGSLILVAMSYHDSCKKLQRLEHDLVGKYFTDAQSFKRAIAILADWMTKQNNVDVKGRIYPLYPATSETFSHSATALVNYHIDKPSELCRRGAVANTSLSDFHSFSLHRRRRRH